MRGPTLAYMQSARVLVVEDDATLRGMLRDLFQSEGYEVETAADGQRGLHKALTESFDAFVIDRGLPAIEGIDLLMRLRKRGNDTPALILSALNNPMDRVAGLDAGAEDYVGKPFDIDELLARLRALLRRHRDSAEVLTIPGGTFDVEARTVVLASGASMVLSPREGELLEHLARSPRQVLTREDLLDLVFVGSDDIGLVDTYVHYLRRKVGRPVVTTVRGLGYRLGELTS